MTSIPGGPTYFRVDQHGQGLIGFAGGREVSLQLPVRFTSYNGTVVQGELSMPINAVYTHDDAVAYHLYFKDGIEARWRPEYGETLEQVEP